MGERVYSVTDYYGGIRGGIADYPGRPHYYESRREAAFHAGETSMQTHPNLPENHIHADASFEVDEPRPMEHGIRRFLVEWNPIIK